MFRNTLKAISAWWKREYRPILSLRKDWKIIVQVLCFFAIFIGGMGTVYLTGQVKQLGIENTSIEMMFSNSDLLELRILQILAVFIPFVGMMVIAAINGRENDKNIDRIKELEAEIQELRKA